MRPTSIAKAAAWRQRIAAQATAGQSIRSFCRQHGLREKAFYRWRAKLQLPPESAGTGPAAASSAQLRRGQHGRKQNASISFARVRVVNPTPAADVEPMRLRLCSGRELLIPPSLPVESLARLLCLIDPDPSGSNASTGHTEDAA